MNVIELETAVSQLPPDELARFTKWFSAYQQCCDCDTKLTSLFEEGLSYPIGSPHCSFAAAEAMMQALALDKANQE